MAKVYTSVRQLLDSMMAKKGASQRVVLIDFPIAGQKSIGFLTRTLNDATSGLPLAAVLVPNAINPTSAFLQILPMERVIETDLTMEQAMSMVMTGGAVGPETIRYSPDLSGGAGAAAAPRHNPGLALPPDPGSACSLRPDLPRHARFRRVTLRRLTCSKWAQINPTGTMLRNVANNNVVAHAVDASGAAPKKLDSAAATAAI